MARFKKYNPTTSTWEEVDIPIEIQNIMQSERNLNIYGGGNIKWGVTSNLLEWDAPFYIRCFNGHLTPSGNFIKTININSSNIGLSANWNCAYITIPNSDSATVTMNVGSVFDNFSNDKIILAVKDGNGNLIFKNGLIMPYNSTMYSNGKLSTYMDFSNIVPPGTVIYFAKNTAPTGYLKCNGAAISRTTYNSLFSAIGTTFGSGDNSSTFNLPDLRGEFIRGWDDSRGVDSSRVFGSFQEATGIGMDSNSYTTGLNNTDGTNGTNTGNTGGTGTGSFTYYKVRPRNIALLPCIKY